MELLSRCSTRGQSTPVSPGFGRSLCEERSPSKSWSVSPPSLFLGTILSRRISRRLRTPSGQGWPGTVPANAPRRKVPLPPAPAAISQRVWPSLKWATVGFSLEGRGERLRRNRLLPPNSPRQGVYNVCDRRGKHTHSMELISKKLVVGDCAPYGEDAGVGCGR